MSTNTLTITDNRTGKQYELPIETKRSEPSICGNSKSQPRSIRLWSRCAKSQSKVALEVAREALRAGLADADLDELEQTVSRKMWKPDYVPLRLAA